ncbi:DNA-binding protein WhiA [Pseudogracilibacillus sp. ICA-222130]|uniref:DNA-binding protein WhiA n=1 Tax=Pseudogracilibacillus sp. ICA-222130 TaxID=3134655 RepID=UPI0030BDDB4A
MSFTSEIKKELITLEDDLCCKKAELTALIRMNGVISTIGTSIMLDVQTENAAIARRIFTLMKEVFPSNIEILVRKKMKLKKNNIYIVRMREAVDELFSILKIDYEDEGFEYGPISAMYEKDCCHRAYLRGAFIARGSINNPETSSYHLEIFNLDPEHNHELLQLMNEYNLKARELQRRNGYIVYMKEAEKITEFLNIIGAHKALFKFEDVRIVRDMRNSVNRIVNCETANLNKTISASVRQAEHIKYIKDTVGIEALPERLQEIAKVRLEYPEVPLKELGELLPSGPLSKSGVNHRLKKIEQFAQQLQANDSE